MIIVYWWILKIMELCEKLSNPPISKNNNFSGGARNQRGETNFVWFDHFYADNNQIKNNQGNGGHNVDDGSYDSPDW